MSLIGHASEHAIRALTYMAQNHGEGYHLVRTMAAELQLPQAYLAKVLQPLAARRVLESQRGRGGGFRLARPPREVTLHEIVDSQEDLGRARQCFLGQAECSDERACPMHEFWKHTSQDFLARLQGTSLQDVVRFCSERPASGYPNVRPAPARRRAKARERPERPRRRS